MTESILNSVKKVCGIDQAYTAFDMDLVMHINSLFAELNAIGIGPVQGFMIEDATTTWDAFLGGEMRLNNVRSWMYVRTRLLFDPPTTSYLIAAWEEQAKRMFWYMSSHRESMVSLATALGPIPEIDGGTTL